ncbi:GH32 C-terminal domain-containing protein [Christiangramia portivictoriae]|uniref:GH32 C-terminal domain-containing protein n=1 Tax=Christiangramia portivictoriae TaxID=326069 RepID=UPI0006854E27|nr:GH32 C-terminal domain-containing protein [Christiangramia portivictoriae]
MFRTALFFGIISLFTQDVSSQQAELYLSFDGTDWWENFQKNNQVELFNSPYSLNGSKPQYLWKKQGVENESLLFDGYSTYLEIENVELNSDFELSFWFAPRAFDSAIGNKVSSILDFYSPRYTTALRIGLLKHGQLAIEYEHGVTSERLTNEESYLDKDRWNYVSIKKIGDEINLRINDTSVLEESFIIGFKNFFSENLKLRIGRNSNAGGFGEKFKFNMISGLLDEIKIAKPGETDVVDRNDLIEIRDQDLQKALRLDYSKYGKELYKPAYHATAPAHWMNEPHAPLYYNGKYHLFYQHNPFGPYWGQIHWGHWVSEDMINWKHAEIALAPEKGHMAPDGIWSGSAYVGPDNIPMLFYTAGNLSKDQNQYTSIAVPRDTTDENLVAWEKTNIIVDKPEGYKKNEFRDPFVFQVEEKYYMIVGSGIEGKGGTAPLFESEDATNWRYVKPFYISDIEKYPFLGGMWELPVFLPLRREDGTKTEKYAFLVLPLRNEADVEVFYWIGEFNQDKKQFIPDDPKPKLMDYGDFGFTGPSGFVDPKTGRTIIFSIAQGKYGNLDNYEMGWAHNAGLPVELWLNESNDLRFAPIEEIKSLRGEELVSCDKCIKESLNAELKEVKGDQLEIEMKFKVSNSSQGIEVRRTKDGSTKAMIYYEPETKSVVFDKVQKNPERDFKALKAPIGDNITELNIRVFLDRSMVEIYINDKVSITDRIYFHEEDATGLEITGPENSELEKFSVWRMNGIDWKYVE